MACVKNLSELQPLERVAHLSSDSAPRVESITPVAAIPGGEIAIRGTGFAANHNSRPRVIFGDVEASVLIAGDSYLVARVPDGPSASTVRVASSHGMSSPVEMQLGVQIADNLHPVANPAVDAEGNIYVTYSGQRGQKVPVSLYKVTANYQVKPFVTELMNPTGLALDSAGVLYVSCRSDGTIHRVTPDGRSQLWVEGMGIATGIAFDSERNLFVGDRSGTIFKISTDRQIFVFATLEPSIAAYHLAFSPAGELYVAGPTTSSYDRIVRIDRHGEVSLFYRGLGRPQGLAFDRQGNLYVAASLNGRRGIARITPDGNAELVISGMGLVGLALLPTRRAVLATNSALFSMDWNVEGLPLPI
jgi:sugar lactone lactonase YvrE